MTLLHGSDKKILTVQLFGFEMYAEIPTKLSELIRGGVSKERRGNDTYIDIGGVSVLISKL